MEFTFFLNKNPILLLRGCRQRERDSSYGEDLLSGPPYKLVIIIPTSSVRKPRPGKVERVPRGHVTEGDGVDIPPAVEPDWSM